MKTDERAKYSILVLLLAIWSALFTAGLLHYPGKITLYLGFSLVYLLLVLSAIYRTSSYSYMFIAIFLWLGFWFKLTANYLFLGFFPYGEPVGQFDGAPEAWDLVLKVATLAGLGVISGRTIYEITRPVPYKLIRWTPAPKWYSSVRKPAWALTMFFICAAATLNVAFGIHQVGMVPRTVFTWPANALLAWFLNIGAALAVAVLISWDVALGKRIELPAYAILGEAFLTTVSVISRAAFPFHTAPQAIALFRKIDIARLYSLKQRIVWLLAFIVLLFASVAAVSVVRDYQYSASKATPMPGAWTASGTVPGNLDPNKSAAPKPTQHGEVVSSFRWILAHQLLVNRWIGMEGAMAVTSYTPKNLSLLWDMLIEKRENGKVTAYQAVSNSGYQVPDDRFQFASLPGISAFLYFSGSLWVVAGGMAAVVLTANASERAILCMTANPLVCSLYGMTLANTIAQFGMTPRQDVPQYIMIYVSVLGIWFIQGGGFKNELR